jgi:hypothetical protein
MKPRGCPPITRWFGPLASLFPAGGANQDRCQSDHYPSDEEEPDEARTGVQGQPSEKEAAHSEGEEQADHHRGGCGVLLHGLFLSHVSGRRRDDRCEGLRPIGDFGLASGEQLDRFGETLEVELTHVGELDALAKDEIAHGASNEGLAALGESADPGRQID